MCNIENQKLDLYDIDKVDEKIFHIKDCIDFLEKGFFCYRFNIIWIGIIIGVFSQIALHYISNIFVRDIIAVIFIFFIVVIRKAIILFLLFKSRFYAYKRYNYDFFGLQIVKFRDNLNKIEGENISFDLIQFSNEEVTVRLDSERGKDYIILAAINNEKKYLIAYAPIEEYNKARRKRENKIYHYFR